MGGVGLGAEGGLAPMAGPGSSGRGGGIGWKEAGVMIWSVSADRA
jgi:hypothetical protein